MQESLRSQRARGIKKAFKGTKLLHSVLIGQDKHDMMDLMYNFSIPKWNEEKSVPPGAER